MSRRRVRGVCALALAASAGFAQPTPDATSAPAPPPGPHSGPDRAVEPQRAPRPPGGEQQAPPRAAGPQRPATPNAPSISGLLAELQTHYRAATTASARYRAIDKQLSRQRRTTQRLTAQLAEARARLADARTDAGRLARQQYRGSLGFSPYVRMLLSDEPRRVLDEEHELRRAAERTAALTARLTDAEITTDFYATRARRALDRQQSLADRRKRQRDVVRGRLAAVERLLASLSADQLAALRQFEAYGAYRPYGAYGAPVSRPRGAPVPRATP